MNPIDLEIWKRSDTDPHRMEYVGQPVAQEVFEELKYRLESTGYLPDEYFFMDREWENGREIPQNADIFCTTAYGSEGVYLDVYLKWYDTDQKKYISQSFITGKTLGENGNDLDRMFLITSTITKAFYGENATHSRFMDADGQEDTGGSVFHLSIAEQKTLIGALVEQRERQESAMTQTEQLLRRMTGSITGYMDTVGQRPLHMSDFDKAVLAIRDGELESFKKLLPDLRDRADELLIKAAERPGIVGRKMCILILEQRTDFLPGIYRAACLKAVDIADMEKTMFLLEQAQSHVRELPTELYGAIAEYAYRDCPAIANQIIDRCTPEQMTAVPSYLLYMSMLNDDYHFAYKLSEKGIHADGSVQEIAAHCARNAVNWQMGCLLRDGMQISKENYGAMNAFIQHGWPEAGSILLDRGMDFDAFRQWAAEKKLDLSQNETYAQLEAHWAGMQALEERQDMGMQMS